MLRFLRIENFALIDRLDLPFQAGLIVLTGETGAGKSIVLDALDALLGGRTSNRLIRTGEKQARLEAHFTLTPAVARWLAAQSLPTAPSPDAAEKLESDLMVCSRELTAGRTVRSRSQINGAAVTKTQLESLRQFLVEITAQGQTVDLASADLQRQWLDGFGGASLLTQRQKVATIYQAAQRAHQTLVQRQQAEQQRLQQLDLFEYQGRELNGAELADPQELELLEQERQRLSHTVELQQQSYGAYQVLYANDTGGEACADLLGKGEGILQEMLRYDAEVEPILDMVTAALAQVEEAGRQLNAYGEGLESDPERLQEVEQRISQLKQLCRKYDRTLPELIEYYQEIQAALTGLNGEGQSLEALEAAYKAEQAALVDACAQLTQQRQKAAKTLEKRLVEQLKPLAMDRVQFQVVLTPVKPGATGADQVAFHFSPNPGEPLQPLVEIASGGEMSRFLLALKVCVSQIDGVETMVFDEVDVGVSGRVAQAIAEKLYHLSRQHQVLCVTHQPIVAAMADTHFRVGKQVIDQAPALGKKGKKSSQSSSAATGEAVRTVVRVVPLTEDDRREELAQLAGGQSDQDAIAFAESLLSQAAAIRKG